LGLENNKKKKNHETLIIFFLQALERFKNNLVARQDINVLP